MTIRSVRPGESWPIPYPAICWPTRWVSARPSKPGWCSGSCCWISAGTATVIVPDQIVGQWKQELAAKFRVDYLPGAVEVIGHSAIESIRPERRMLTIVDEAHLLTERVNYGAGNDRDRRYEALCAIAHASTALLLLSATPVRSNEDAFLGLLHLLDPVNYPLT